MNRSDTCWIKMYLGRFFYFAIARDNLKKTEASMTEAKLLVLLF